MACFGWILQDSCLELQLRDATLLPGAIRKMCRALAALPPMEAFIRDVCALVLSRGSAAEVTGGRVPSTKTVLHILQAWAKELRQLQQMQDFVGELQPIILKLSAEGNFTVVLDRTRSNVFYADPSTDITDAVIKELQKQ